MASGMKRFAFASTNAQAALRGRLRSGSPPDSRWWRAQIQIAASVPWKSTSSEPGQGGTLPAPARDRLLPRGEHVPGRPPGGAPPAARRS